MGNTIKCVQRTYLKSTEQFLIFNLQEQISYIRVRRICVSLKTLLTHVNVLHLGH